MVGVSFLRLRNFLHYGDAKNFASFIGLPTSQFPLEKNRFACALCSRNFFRVSEIRRPENAGANIHGFPKAARFARCKECRCRGFARFRHLKECPPKPKARVSHLEENLAYFFES